jgi:hypothetical protein
VVADIVTERHPNLHNEMLALLGADNEPSFPPECHLYAVAYHPVRRDERNLLDLWPEALVLDRPLPVLPLALKGGPTIPVDLEAAFSDARRRCRV